MNEQPLPTDAAIINLAASEGIRVRTGAGAVKFARAVLAKWGTPAVAGEPVGYCHEIKWREHQSEQVQKITREAQPEYGYTQALYTTPHPAQPQAGAVPLPSVELMRLVMDVEQRHNFLRGTTNWAVAVGRAIEAAHSIGIEGGQQ